MKHETILKIQSSLFLAILFVLPIYVCISTLDIKISFFLFILMAVVAFIFGKIFSVSVLTGLLGSREKNEMLNYVTSFITPSGLLSNENHLEKIIRETYRNLSEDEIKELAAESFAIFKSCESIPDNEDFEKLASEKYPFLSKSTLISLHGTVHYMQVK